MHKLNETNWTENKHTSVSILMLAYNQELYIGEAVKGALSQECDNLEIIISDDCSSDSTFSIIESIVEDYRGPHEVKINRNPRNFGLSSHVNHLIEMSGGDLILLLAGDDISLSNRAAVSRKAFEEVEGLSMISTGASEIDQNGNALGSTQTGETCEITIDKYF